MRPWDAHALTRPVFTAEEFTATKFDTAVEKAWFGNALTRFIASDFTDSQWTERLYRRLSHCFGHIAHFDKHGFKAEFFTSTAGKIAFLEETMQHHCFGQPDYTYCDVERLVIHRLRPCGVLTFYRALRAAEIEGAERELLTRLQAKYDGDQRPAQAAPQPIRVAVPTTAARKQAGDTRQANLI